jgi:hypothetical protein
MKSKPKSSGSLRGLRYLALCYLCTIAPLGVADQAGPKSNWVEKPRNIYTEAVRQYFAEQTVRDAISSKKHLEAESLQSIGDGVHTVISLEVEGVPSPSYLMADFALADFCASRSSKQRLSKAETYRAAETAMELLGRKDDELEDFYREYVLAGNDEQLAAWVEAYKARTSPTKLVQKDKFRSKSWAPGQAKRVLRRVCDEKKESSNDRD